MKSKKAYTSFFVRFTGRNGGWSCAQVVDYHTILDGASCLMKSTELIIARPLITIEFDYPIEDPVRFTFCRPTGFSRLDLVACIHKGYEKIYSDARKYNVRSHCMSDLFIEGFIKKSPGLYELEMGS